MSAARAPLLRILPDAEPIEILISADELERYERLVDNVAGWPDDLRAGIGELLTCLYAGSWHGAINAAGRLYYRADRLQEELDALEGDPPTRQPRRLA